jgi:hypothetical protein
MQIQDDMNAVLSFLRVPLFMHFSVLVFMCSSVLVIDASRSTFYV